MIRDPGYLNHVEQAKLMLRLLALITSPSKWVVDIGVSDGTTECVSLEFLKNGYQAACFDKRPEQLVLCRKNMAGLPATIVNAKVTPETVSSLLGAAWVPHFFDILCLDIDSYELSILEALLEAEYRPALIYVEVNETIPPPVLFSVNYHPDQTWEGNNNFFGVSLQKLHDEFCWHYDYVVLDMFQQNVLLCAEEMVEALGVVPETDMADLYQRGWRSVVNVSYPWPTNRQYEGMWTMTPKQVVEHLRQCFAEHEDRYSLSL